MTAAIQTISLEGLTRADWLKLRRRGKSAAGIILSLSAPGRWSETVQTLS